MDNTLSTIQKFASACGHGIITEILHTAKVFHDGWEMDNDLWVCKTSDGSILAYTTDHGGLRIADLEYVKLCISKTKDSLHSLVKAEELLTEIKQ
jgi:hypothetical protein